MIKQKFAPAAKACSMVKDRIVIQSSKFLNNLLHKNQLGLHILFEEAQIDNIYTYQSADEQFNVLVPGKGKNFIENLREQFIYC